MVTRGNMSITHNINYLPHMPMVDLETLIIDSVNLVTRVSTPLNLTKIMSFSIRWQKRELVEHEIVTAG